MGASINFIIYCAETVERVARCDGKIIRASDGTLGVGIHQGTSVMHFMPCQSVFVRKKGGYEHAPVCDKVSTVCVCVYEEVCACACASQAALFSMLSGRLWSHDHQAAPTAAMNHCIIEPPLDRRGEREEEGGEQGGEGGRYVCVFVCLCVWRGEGGVQE